MSEQYLVVEVLDPRAPGGVTNIYVSLDADLDSISNGFKALTESGQKPTGTVTRAVRVDGIMRRVERFPVQRQTVWQKLFYRTMSAFLRA